jgi:type II secretory pathway pseudopilin PulG
MKTPSHSSDTNLRCLRAAFTLTETVIAIGVLAVVLTGFIAVFTPAAQGIRRSISSEQADRLTTTLENELATLRANSENPAPAPAFATSFDKAFKWIQEGNKPANAIIVYQYRGDPTATPRTDGTPPPKVVITGEPGKDYIVQSMARRLGDTELANDLKAIEGSVFFVKPTQLRFTGGATGGALNIGTFGQIRSADNTPANNAAEYKEAVIAFTAEFHSVPTKSLSYLNSDGFKDPTKGKFYSSKPIFTRNLAVRR